MNRRILFGLLIFLCSRPARAENLLEEARTLAHQALARVVSFSDLAGYPISFVALAFSQAQPIVKQLDRANIRWVSPSDGDRACEGKEAMWFPPNRIALCPKVLGLRKGESDRDRVARIAELEIHEAGHLAQLKNHETLQLLAHAYVQGPLIHEQLDMSQADRPTPPKIPETEAAPFVVRPGGHSGLAGSDYLPFISFDAWRTDFEGFDEPIVLSEPYDSEPGVREYCFMALRELLLIQEDGLRVIGVCRLDRVLPTPAGPARLGEELLKIDTEGHPIIPNYGWRLEVGVYLSRDREKNPYGSGKIYDGLSRLEYPIRAGCETAAGRIRRLKGSKLQFQADCGPRNGSYFSARISF